MSQPWARSGRRAFRGLVSEAGACGPDGFGDGEDVCRLILAVMSRAEGAAPYSDLVGAADPLELLASTPGRIAELVRNWDSARWSLSYAEGKWSAAQVVLHLAHDELAWSTRIRLALTTSGYVPHPFDGADWIALESPVDAAVAFGAFVALRRLNMALYSRLTAEQRSLTIPHPEFGTISIDWILRVLAGHDLHHLGHLRAISVG